jgi:hypothetical protein
MRTTRALSERTALFGSHRRTLQFKARRTLIRELPKAAAFSAGALTPSRIFLTSSSDLDACPLTFQNEPALHLGNPAQHGYPLC